MGWCMVWCDEPLPWSLLIYGSRESPWYWQRDSCLGAPTSILFHYGSTSTPRPSNILTVVADSARHCMMEGPYYALHYMRVGMTTGHQSLWSHPPSDTSVFSLLNSYTPTAETVISRFQVELGEDPNQAALEVQVVDWFHQFIFSSTSAQLMILLRFITSSDILNGHIRVSFNGSQNEMVWCRWLHVDVK